MSDDQFEGFSDLVCPICMNLMQHPRLLPNCSTPHRFCAACIGLWLSGGEDCAPCPFFPPCTLHDPCANTKRATDRLRFASHLAQRRTCPIDRRALGLAEQPTRDVNSERQLATLRVPCPNARFGCAEQVPAAAMSTHAASACEYRPVECALCGSAVPLHALAGHARRCHSTCADCGSPVPRRDAGNHRLLWCLARAHGTWHSEADACGFRQGRLAYADGGPFAWQVQHLDETCDWPATRLALDATSTHIGLAAAGPDGWVAALTAAALELCGVGLRPSLALAFAEKALEELGADPALTARAHACAAAAALELARPTTALRHFDAALALVPRTLPALVGRAAALGALGDASAAAQAHAHALCEARALAPLRRFGRAGARVEPSAEGCGLELGWRQWEWTAAAAEVCARDGDLAGAEELVRDALNAPQCEADEAQAGLWLALGRLQLSAYALDHAASACAQRPSAAVDAEPVAGAPPIGAVGVAAAPEADAPAAAAAAAGAALPILPAPPVSRYALDKLDDAADSFARAAARAPHSARARYASGVTHHELALQRSGSGTDERGAALAQAALELEAALALAPDLPDVRLRLSHVLVERHGRPAEPSARVGAPAHGGGHVGRLEAGRGAVAGGASRQGREPACALARAAALLRGVVSARPTDQTARLLLAVALFRIGKPSEARASLLGCEAALAQATGTALPSRTAPDALAPGAQGEGGRARRQGGGGSGAVLHLDAVGGSGGGGCTLAVLQLPLAAALEALCALAQSTSARAPREGDESAEAVHRRLTRALPPLLQASLGAHGYSSCYCLLEALYLEAYAGLVGALARADGDAPASAASSAAASEDEGSAGGEGGALALAAPAAAAALEPARLALALQGCVHLFSLVQGRLQYRELAHRTAALAVRLAPLEPRAHLIVGEAILDMPMSQHTTRDAIDALETAVRLASAACGAAADSLQPAEAAAAGGAGAPSAARDAADAADETPRSPRPTAASAALGQAAPAQEYWIALARAHTEAGSSPAQIERLYSQSIALAPFEIDAYVELGRLLECRRAFDEALEVYTRYCGAVAAAERDDAAPLDFNRAVIENAIANLLVSQRRYTRTADADRLALALGRIGVILGVLAIEKYVVALDAADEVDVIKKAYMHCLPVGTDTAAFFRHKGWTQKEGSIVVGAHSGVL